MVLTFQQQDVQYFWVIIIVNCIIQIAPENSERTLILRHMQTRMVSNTMLQFVNILDVISFFVLGFFEESIYQSGHFQSINPTRDNTTLRGVYWRTRDLM